MMSVQVSTRIDAATEKQFDDICDKVSVMSRDEVFGCMRGQFTMSDDFNEPLDDFEEYMMFHVHGNRREAKR